MQVPDLTHAGLRLGMAIPAVGALLLQGITSSDSPSLTAEVAKYGAWGLLGAWALWWYQSRWYPDTQAKLLRDEQAEAARETALGAVIAAKDATIAHQFDVLAELARAIAGLQPKP